MWASSRLFSMQELIISTKMMGGLTITSEVETFLINISNPAE